MKRAFTIVELLVVVAILSILLGVLLPTLGGASESARAAKCLANLHNLAVTWDGGPAADTEIFRGNFFENDDGDTLGLYLAQPGWVAGNTIGLYSWINGEFGRLVEEQTKIDPISMWETNEELARYTITNGWYYTRTQADADAYVCPEHQKLRRGAQCPLWSYFMNVRMNAVSLMTGRKASLTNADLLLLFAEIPFRGPGEWFPAEKGSETETDGVLQYEGYEDEELEDDKGVVENIGGNHKSGKQWYAHVAFADGHVEKLRVDGLSAGALRDLTKWLCTGTAVGRRGNVYEEIKAKEEEDDE